MTGERAHDHPRVEHPGPTESSWWQGGDHAPAALLARAHTMAPYELADGVDACARSLGVEQAVVYLADLQQEWLVPLAGRDVGAAGALAVTDSVAGRAYQRVELHTEPAADGLHASVPLLDGTERLGVLAVRLPGPAALDGEPGRVLVTRLRGLASLTGSWS